jgi:hypothetical protein
MMLLPAAIVRDYTAVIVMLSIAGAALVLAAVWYLVARAHGVNGASVGKYWLRIFPILCLLTSAAIWFGIILAPEK